MEYEKEINQLVTEINMLRNQRFNYDYQNYDRNYDRRFNDIFNCLFVGYQRYDYYVSDEFLNLIKKVHDIIDNLILDGVKEGHLIKKRQNGSGQKRYYFVLKGGWLYCHKGKMVCFLRSVMFICYLIIILIIIIGIR